MRSLIVNTAPTTEPLTLAEAKDHLRVDHSDEDSLIAGLVASARELLEGWKGQAFITQTLDLWLDRWPYGGAIDLPRPPLQSVTSVTYYDTVDAASAMSASDYHVDTDSRPGRVELGYGKSWPSTTLRPAHAIRVRYVAGYGSATAVPENIKHMMKLLVGNMYAHREPVITGTVAVELPLGLRAMLGERYVDTLVEC